MYHRYSTYFCAFSVSIPGWIMFSPIVCIVFLLCPTCSKNRHGLFVLQLKITNFQPLFVAMSSYVFRCQIACLQRWWLVWVAWPSCRSKWGKHWVEIPLLDGLELPNWDDIMGRWTSTRRLVHIIILCPYGIICIHICHLCKFRTFVHICTWVQAYVASTWSYKQTDTCTVVHLCVCSAGTGIPAAHRVLKTSPFNKGCFHYMTAMSHNSWVVHWSHDYWIEIWIAYLPHVLDVCKKCLAHAWVERHQSSTSNSWSALMHRPIVGVPEDA